ncbi:hypothetical protein ASPZODRAFT_29416 [Penicilliopsis zonata CBS 506.65]|uniref:Cytochrome b561 domain-containing protein n=1 Tax=Penicilliopsis zonata CBS 506.65 TaxID=1073090 RepID=A0A1L9S4U4_9EURO|nr:hypothetical protein ASPZODRAFT_29416 [Penicilliopsis zonata CBS 506.65]OJJ42161.1 hypothetical protein ASPZODRAFT_29416 [Penicilliopsis zonata CBS 506.65]
MSVLLWLWFIAVTLAQVQTFTPPRQEEITYSVNVPESTASTGSGPIYLQLYSLRPLTWFAWGQGAQMQGANIMLVYTAPDGHNVTVSPRLGVEHVMPLYNPQARVALLGGSGINSSTGAMTANIRCDSCLSWPGGQEDVHNTASPWIWAVKYGSPLVSDSVSVVIAIHDMSGVAALDLSRTTGGTSDNPFVGSSSPVNDSTDSSAGQSISAVNLAAVHTRRVAHAVLMILVFVVLLPTGAFLPRLVPYPHIVVVHAGVQLLALSLAIAGMGIGLSMGQSLHLLQFYHPIIGMVVVCSLALFQPVMGLLQHRYFRRTRKKGVFAYPHRWLGRAAITLAIINGGLGFRLAGVGSSIAPTGAVIAYSVVAGVVWLAMASTSPKTGNPVAEPDDPQNDSDNVSLSSAGTDYTSLRSSVLEYEYENGRRYQSYRKGQYLFPNDDEEQDRMDFLHHIYGMILGGELHRAPVKGDTLGRVLGIGTGTGIWAIDFAEYNMIDLLCLRYEAYTSSMYPSAEVIGNDLSPIQPRWLPPNCVFEVDDFEAEWGYNRPFDYIHGRELDGAIKDVNRLATQAFNNLRAGGYFELQALALDIFSDDDSLNERGPFTAQMCELAKEASAKFGKPMGKIETTWPDALRSAGFVDVVLKMIKVPINPWPKDPKQKNIGLFMQLQQTQAIGSFLLGILTTVLGWSEEETTVMGAKMRKELYDLSVHQYAKMYFVYGRHP